MKKLIVGVLVVSIFNLFIGCSSRSVINTNNPPIGQSVVITLQDGKVLKGVLLKKEGENIKYIDSTSGKPENLTLKQIQKMVHSDTVFDLEGKVITEPAISDAKGMSKTLAYGFGGFVLGAAAGFGVGALMQSESMPLVYPMAGLGVVGAVYFGMMGSDSDREDAIDTIRSSRYKVSQEKLKNRLEEEKQKLLDQQKQQEEQKKEMQKKDN
ncbi:MAG: hypothetical protein E4H13_06635 [Calditrichales bacterium]|nr:MAG: hypothetical protein E4H13_06635 [Calditrichales bacterium]